MVVLSGLRPNQLVLMAQAVESSARGSRAHDGRPARSPRREGVRLTEPQLQQLVCDYEAGLNMRPLARKYGIHRLTVAAHLRRAGVELRYQGLADDEIKAAAQLYRNGWSLQRLADRYDCTAETVRQALKAHSVTMRKPWERG